MKESYEKYYTPKEICDFIEKHELKQHEQSVGSQCFTAVFANPPFSLESDE